MLFYKLLWRIPSFLDLIRDFDLISGSGEDLRIMSHSRLGEVLAILKNILHKYPALQSSELYSSSAGLISKIKSMYWSSEEKSKTSLEFCKYWEWSGQKWPRVGSGLLILFLFCLQPMITVKHQPPWRIITFVRPLTSLLWHSAAGVLIQQLWNFMLYFKYTLLIIELMFRNMQSLPPTSLSVCMLW